MSSNITGEIFWIINGEAFPDNSWNDFVVIVLGWWADAIVRLLEGTSTEETMFFMDGPWSIECDTKKKSIVCRFVDGRSEPRVVHTWTGETSVWGKIIFIAGKAALRGCHLKGLSNPDIGTLEKCVIKLRKLLKISH